jgi:hypothetical protein
MKKPPRLSAGAEAASEVQYQLPISLPASPPQDTAADHLIGLQVLLERSIDQREPCHGNLAFLCPGKGPHAYALSCATCLKFRGWLPKEAVNFISETVRLFGVPDEPLTIRDATQLKPKGTANETR